MCVEITTRGLQGLHDKFGDTTGDATWLANREGALSAGLATVPQAASRPKLESGRGNSALDELKNEVSLCVELPGLRGLSLQGLNVRVHMLGREESAPLETGKQEGTRP